MRKFYHTIQKSFLDPAVSCNLNKYFTIKIVCDDGVIYCDRLLFIIWSKKWLQILDPFEETNVLIFPDVEKRTMELLLELLKKGELQGFESHFENFMEQALDFLADLPDGFSNFVTYDPLNPKIKTFDMKAATMKRKKNNFKTFKNITCEFCLSTFASKQSKNRHIEIEHQAKKVYTCSICNLTFKSKEGLCIHKKLKHSNAGLKYCSICDAKFTSETDLKRHKRSKHHEDKKDLEKGDNGNGKDVHHIDSDERDNQHGKDTEDLEKRNVYFDCSECDFKTLRKDSLLRHMRLKHQLYYKEFKAIERTLKANSIWTCSECEHSYKTVEEIKEHVINCKDIRCHFCDTKFTLTSNLKRHLKKEHPFLCPYCNKRFKNEEILKKHTESCQNLE